METPERPIVIRSADGESFEFDPPDDLWFDMLAYCEVSGESIDSLIKAALKDFFLRGMKEAQ